MTDCHIQAASIAAAASSARWGLRSPDRIGLAKSGSQTAVPHQRGTAVKEARKRRCWCASGPHAHGGRTTFSWMKCTKTRTWRSWTATLAREAASMAGGQKRPCVRADVSRNREGPLDPHRTTPYWLRARGARARGVSWRDLCAICANMRECGCISSLIRPKCPYL